MSKKTLEAIIKSENDYLIEVKGNQPKLFEEVKKNVELSKPLDKHITEEKNRGRIEKRETYIYDELTNINPEWKGINKLVKMIRSGIRQNQPYNETHYFISSLTTNNAQTYSTTIRTHWGIENELHYVKDVNMNEDKSRIKGDYAAENLSVFKNIAINIYRANGMKSIKYASRKFINKIEDQFMLIKNININFCHI